MDHLLRLLNIMELLRDPDNGCAWDIKQTFSSIAPFTIEEVYEVVDAIEQQDYKQLRDELGDLLFQIVYYTQMAREQNLFEFDDVAKNICDKLVRRHPHVFESKECESAVNTWELIKNEERELEGQNKKNSLLASIPKNLPQLLRAKKIQKYASSIGFDWSNVNDVMQKVKEEFKELNSILHGNNQDKIEEELGDVLFSVVNLSRHLMINPEDALRKSNNKFICRFEYIENKVKNNNKSLQECTLEELDKYWNEAKERII